MVNLIFILDSPSALLSGTYAGISGDGCTPPGSGDKICALIGTIVTFTCAVSPGDDYTIGFTESDGSIRVLSTNGPAMVTVNADSFGTYVCNATNPCGHNISTLILQSAGCELKITN